MSKTPKIWTVFEAATYIDGRKQESLDARFDSSGKHRMVRLEDYQDLKAELAEAQKVIRNAHAEYATAPGLECSCKYCINADIKELE